MRQLLGEHGIRARDIRYTISMFNEIRKNIRIRMIWEENLFQEVDVGLTLRTSVYYVRNGNLLFLQ